MAQYKYNPKTGQFGMVAPDGSVKPIPATAVPPDVRARTVAKFNPPPSLEQRYEKQFERLPGPLKYVLPGTMGEATGLGTGLAAAALAPETGGLSIAAPVAAAAGAGYLEPSNEPWLSGERFKRAGIEGGKELAGLGFGKIIGKTAELAGRYAAKGGMLEKSAQRIGQGVRDLMNAYPFKTPQTARELREQIANGNLVERIGRNLGEFREMLTGPKGIKPYRAAVPGSQTLVPASPGVPTSYAYTAAKRKAGELFRLPDLDAEGKVIWKDMGVGDAIDHVRRLQALSYTASGAGKGGELSPLYRQTAHDARQIMINRFNQIGPKLGRTGMGDNYAAMSADYGTALSLEDIFKTGTRTSRIGGESRAVVDQAAILKKLNKEMPDLTKLQGGKAVKFQGAVAPTLAEATPETGWGGRIGGGLSGIHSMLHPPHPYMPETRTMLPFYARPLTSRIAAPLFGSPAQRTIDQLLQAGPPMSPAGGTP